MQKIVIVGGGAGGLELASRLSRTLGRKKQAEITLVDRSRTHIWKPLLHEVAAGVIDKHSDGVDYAIHAAAHHYRFQLGEMCSLNAQAQTITLSPLIDEEGTQVLPEREIHYDQLVLAVGSVSNDFGTPGVAEHCYFLDSLKQAERFHRALLISLSALISKKTKTPELMSPSSGQEQQVLSSPLNFTMWLICLRLTVCQICRLLDLKLLLWKPESAYYRRFLSA